jgi:hypothetical protein
LEKVNFMKVLLLTDVPPSTNFTGGIFLNQLISFLPHDNVACFTVLNPALEPALPPSFSDIAYRKVAKPREDWGNSLGKWGRYRSLIMEAFSTGKDIPRIRTEIVKFADNVQPDVLWCVLQGQTMIRLARPSARSLKIPLITSIWDPPGWWMRVNKVHPIVSRQVIDEFGETIRASRSTGTASWAMAKEYASLFGARTVPFLPSLPLESALQPAEQPSNGETFTIGIGRLANCWAQSEDPVTRPLVWFGIEWKDEC